MNAKVINLFNHFAQRSSQIMGSAPVFLASVFSVVLWAITGPYFHYSESWQLVVNTVTDIITFWMVFVIQNSQNRDTRIIHLKLDETILSLERANNHMINIDELTDEQLARLEKKFKQLTPAADPKAEIPATKIEPEDTGNTGE